MAPGCYQQTMALGCYQPPSVWRDGAAGV